MHPAYSVIWFTTMSGAGYGLAAYLGLGIARIEGWMAFISYGIAIALISIGLLSSTLHLGHPERAWRAFSQWRSSWLSREGVLAIVTFVPLSICAISATFFDLDFLVAGLLMTLLSIATIYTTSMIYASLKTIHHWYSWLTSACYLGFAASSGFLLLTAISQPFLNSARVPFVAIALVVLAWIIKGFWWYRADNSASASTMSSALGLPEKTNLKRLELPHTGTNYLMKEMGHHVARKHALKLRVIAIALGLVVPILCLIAASSLTGMTAQFAAVAALLTHYAGIVVERWLFFAQAKHTVMLYYGAETA